MKKQAPSAPARPASMILFGESAFARGFWGRLLQNAADKGEKDTEAILVREAPGKTEPEEFQLVCKGESGVRETRVTRFVRAVDPFLDEEAFFSLADDARLTTILWSPEGTPWMLKNGKIKNEKHHALAQLTMLLFRRFCLEKSGVTVVPTTPGAFNGRTLKKQVYEFASLRTLGMDFINWLNMEVRFVNTLAQSTVEGFDGQTVSMENFELFLTDRADTAVSRFATVVDDLAPYYKAEKFLYGGALASSCAYALLHGVNTVTSFMAREKLAKHMTVSVFEEIIPALHADFAIQQSYAMDMFARFSNPRVVFPWETDDLVGRFAESLTPVITAYVDREGIPPRHLTFGLACTIQWMRLSEPDEPRWQDTDALLADEALWGADLTFLARDVSAFLEKMNG